MSYPAAATCTPHLFHTRRDERHGNVALDPVHAHPRRQQRQDACHEVNQLVGGVVAVQTVLPQLVQPSA
eukprot:364772-Chlamydomonas_euryale.AAC.2